jgi:uncharacterized protein YjiS (DUF1127 family)
MTTLDQGIRIGTAGIGAPRDGAVAGSIPDFIAGLARKIAARRAEARAAREAEAALLALSDRELRDIGLTRDQVPLRERGLRIGERR